jgi:hypothetical protein
MGFCPSHDWDRYINEQDEAAAAEVAFYEKHAALIAQMAGAMFVHYIDPKARPDDADIKMLVDDAAKIVQAIVGRGLEQ